MTGQPSAVGEGDGAQVSPEDERWRAASQELAPEKFLVRVTTNARATVTMVALVGTALTGFGLVSAQTLLTDELPRRVALAVAAAAFTAVLLAVVFHAQRLDDVNIEDLADVERWYQQQFRRARLAVAASWLLVLAVLLAAMAALLALTGGPDDDVAASLRATRGDDSSTVDAQVTVTGLSVGSVLRTSLIAGAGANCSEVTLWQGTSRAGQTGQVTVEGAARAALCHRSFRLELHDGNERLLLLTVP